MSGLELGALVIGIVPLIIEVLKCYDAVKEKCFTFRNSISEVSRLHRKLRWSEGMFQLLCKRLLELGGFSGHPKDLSAIQDQQDILHGVHQVLKHTLGDMYEPCGSLVKEIREIVKQLDDDLKALEKSTSECQSSELSEPVARLRLRFKTVFDKPKIESSLKLLKGHNADLNQLLAQFNGRKPKEQILPEPTADNPAKELPRRFAQVNSASGGLYASIERSWSCKRQGGSQHAFRIGLKTEVKDGVYFNLGIVCREGDLGQDSLKLVEHKSKASQWFTVHALANLSDAGIKRTGTCSDALIKKRRGSGEKDHSRGTYLSETKAADPYINLLEFDDYCFALRQAAHKSPFKYGALWLTGSQKYIISVKPSPVALPRKSLVEIPSEPQTLREAIMLPLIRYRVALQLAQSVLQFHGTRWLKDDWRLHDFAFFSDRHEPTEDSLHTLHLNANIYDKSHGRLNSDRDEEKSEAEIWETVNNRTLFSLGRAMLELSFCKPMPELLLPGRSEVTSARKLAETQMPLGRRYAKIVERCLKGNFCEETELTKPRFQSAFYHGVIWKLEDMIRSLNLED